MTRGPVRVAGRQVVGWLTVGLVASVCVLIWFGYRGIAEWRGSAFSLAARRATEKVDLLVTALTRDMRGVQQSVLLLPGADEFMRDPPYDVRDLVVSAFARYPYPESFFAWRRGPADTQVLFFARAGRLPEWIPEGPVPAAFPVVVATHDAIGRALLERIDRDARRRRRFSVYEVSIAGAPHQVVARLLYQDGNPDVLDGVFGFTVNLGWVREHYFPELTAQVERILIARGGPSLSVLDERGHRVAGPAPTAAGSTIRRPFSMLFVDPLLVSLDPPRTSLATHGPWRWTSAPIPRWARR